MVGACFNPSYDEPTCGPGGTCPATLVCRNQVCVGSEVDAAANGDAQQTIIDAMELPSDAMATGTVENLPGTWLLAIDPKPIAPGAFVQLRVDWQLSPAHDMLTGSYQPLTTYNRAPDSPDRLPVGAPLTDTTNVAVGDSMFSIHLVGQLPGEANPANFAVSIDNQLEATVQSPSFVCGTVTGTVGPYSADGSTFAAIPYDPSTGTLPAPVAECPP